MPSFQYTVDTQPMAEELSSVSRRVDLTTDAVVAMQLAVIEAEDKAADHVCSNVNRGFYSLIRSQISQKIARLQSEVDSQLMQLNLQRQGLQSIKSRMERDYHMITTRYLKLFNGLNANLKSRVFELDKPAIDFVEKEVNKMANRSKNLSGTFPVIQLESIADSQKILASNIKQKGISLISSMSRFIHEMNLQKILTSKILINDRPLAKAGLFYLPIVITETKDDRTGDNNINIILPEMPTNNSAKVTINNMVYNQCISLKWSNDNERSEKISMEFYRLIQKSDNRKRVKDTAERLFQLHQFTSF